MISCWVMVLAPSCRLKPVFTGGYAGTENPHDVDTVVLVKTLILDGDKGVCQIGGNLIHRNGTRLESSAISFAIWFPLLS